MKNAVFIISLWVAILGATTTFAGETPKTNSAPTPSTLDTPSTSPSTNIQSQNTDPSLMMKIQEDDNSEAARRKALIEELRKLYKANFL